MGGCLEKPTGEYEHEVASSSDRTCEMNIYTVDPRLLHHGQTSVMVVGEFAPGPKSDDVVVIGMPREYPPTDADGNFLYDPKTSLDAFDAAHCVAVVARVVHMYRRTLLRIGQSASLLRWHWGGAPIKIRPYAGERPEACYSREAGQLHFGYIRNPTVKDEMIHLCRSFDIVAHQAGHAVLDGLRSNFMGDNVSEEMKAMHESFADLTAVFCFISNLEVCEKLAMHCNGDFGNVANYVPFIDNQEMRDIYGGREFGFRNVALGVKVTDVVAEHIDWSRAFTSAMFEITVRLAAPNLHPKRGRAEALHLSGLHMCGMLVRAYLEAPIFNATFSDVAKYIVKAESDRGHRAIMKEEFTSRKFFDKNEMPKRWDGVNKLGGCVTLVERVTRF